MPSAPVAVESWSSGERVQERPAIQAASSLLRACWALRPLRFREVRLHRRRRGGVGTILGIASHSIGQHCRCPGVPVEWGTCGELVPGGGGALGPPCVDNSSAESHVTPPACSPVALQQPQHKQD